MSFDALHSKAQGGHCGSRVPVRGDSLPAQERAALVAIAVVIVGFGAVTLYRSAYGPRRMTDADVYFRAAWAARTGADLYRVEDDNGWSYTYPPTLATLLIPFADPPGDEPVGRLMPYPVAIVIWYALSVAALLAACHWIARAVEECRESGPPPRGTPSWWRNRTWPAVLCATAIGSTAGRGQANLLVLWLLGGMLLSAVRGQSWRAGFWLAAAAVLKVFPAYLLVYPLWRRDWRWLAGTLLAGAVLACGVPALIVGPRRALALDTQYLELMVRPQFSKEDSRKTAELAASTDNQSFMAIAYVLADAPHLKNKVIDPDPAQRIGHWILAAVLTVLALAASGVARQVEPRTTLMAIAVLTCLMLPITPMCHLHYFVLALPLVAALIVPRIMDSDPRVLLRRVLPLSGAYILLNTIPRIPALGYTRLFGLAQLTNLGLFVVGLRVLWHARQARCAPASPAVQSAVN